MSALTVTGWDTGVLVELMSFYQSYVISDWQQRLLQIQARIDRWATVMHAVEIASVILAMTALAMLVITKLRERRKPHGKH